MRHRQTPTASPESAAKGLGAFAFEALLPKAPAVLTPAGGFFIFFSACSCPAVCDGRRSASGARAGCTNSMRACCSIGAGSAKAAAPGPFARHWRQRQWRGNRLARAHLVHRAAPQGGFQPQAKKRTGTRTGCLQSPRVWRVRPLPPWMAHCDHLFIDMGAAVVRLHLQGPAAAAKVKTHLLSLQVAKQAPGGDRPRPIALVSAALALCQKENCSDSHCRKKAAIGPAPQTLRLPDPCRLLSCLVLSCLVLSVKWLPDHHAMTRLLLTGRPLPATLRCLHRCRPGGL